MTNRTFINDLIVLKRRRAAVKIVAFSHKGNKGRALEWFRDYAEWCYRHEAENVHPLERI